MPWTLDQLFQQGAHHTVESLIERGEATFSDVISALERRYNTSFQGNESEVAQLLEQVTQAVVSGGSISGLDQPSPLAYGRNPALPDEYQYIVIGSLPSPLNPDEQISVPWTINSPVPLSFLEVLDQAQAELNQGYERDQKYMAASYADLHRRDIAFQRQVQEEYGGEAPIDVEIIGAYRRG